MDFRDFKGCQACLVSQDRLAHRVKQDRQDRQGRWVRAASLAHQDRLEPQAMPAHQAPAIATGGTEFLRDRNHLK